MPFPNGAEPGAERHAAANGLASGADDVTITIRGFTAARMLGRGDAEKRILDELDALRQRLDGMDEAAAQRALQYEAVNQLLQGLQAKAEHLARQVDARAAELDRLRSDLDGQSFRAASLPGKVDQVQEQVNLLIGQLDRMQRQLADLAGAMAGAPPPGVSKFGAGGPANDGSGHKPGWLERWRPQHQAPANGSGEAPAGWLRQRLNGFWFW